MIVVSTDGSCLKNPNGPSGWAWFVDESLHDSGPITEGTNQIAELRAIEKALEAFPNDSIEIQTDSAYALNAVTVWYKNWEKNGWKNSQGKVVANQDIIKRILFLIRERTNQELKFTKVKGHAPKGTHPGNERADVLAKAAAASIK